MPNNQTISKKTQRKACIPKINLSALRAKAPIGKVRIYALLTLSPPLSTAKVVLLED